MFIPQAREGGQEGSGLAGQRWRRRQDGKSGGEKDVLYIILHKHRHTYSKMYKKLAKMLIDSVLNL